MSAPAPLLNVAVVRPITGEPTTFEVKSKTNSAAWYRVSISDHHGAGECQCIRWQTVCWPLIRDTQHLPPGRRCRHLKAAREFALNIAIAQHNREHPSE